MKSNSYYSFNISRYDELFVADGTHHTCELLSREMEAASVNCLPSLVEEVNIIDG
jgi:hypothetical protein